MNVVLSFRVDDGSVVNMESVVVEESVLDSGIWPQPKKTNMNRKIYNRKMRFVVIECTPGC